ncbi:MAG TPA: Zn-ribbon domain-containing OB-fold protein [Candidatus Altiarchaeales archaeon]|nr:Zn-ribbon domain-containing OB-fold protein [Candidatus Altiarchaeales archaeon]
MSEGIALHWRLIQPRYNLIGTECKTCGKKFFPPRNICPDCRRKSEIAQYQFCGRGEVYSHTIIRAAPTGHEYQKPYVIAIIQLEEGPFVTAQMVDCDVNEVEIGMPVKQCFRKIIADSAEGIIRYAYKFIPVKD